VGVTDLLFQCHGVGARSAPRRAVTQVRLCERRHIYLQLGFTSETEIAADVTYYHHTFSIPTSLTVIPAAELIGLSERNAMTFCPQFS
jgi:hypothetical protein